MDYIQADVVTFELALRCVQDIKKFVYLDVNMQKLRNYTSQNHYKFFLRKLVDYRVRSDVINVFTKLDVHMDAYTSFEDIAAVRGPDYVLYLDIFY